MAIVPVRRLIVWFLFLWVVLAPRVGVAHRLPPEVIAFFKVDGARLHVVVRVPTAILLDARLPTVQTTMLDLSAIDGALKGVAAEVARSLEVSDGGRPLTPERTAWILSTFTDRSFASYESAAARLSGPAIPADQPVYWNEAYVDIQYAYALASAAPQITARLNGLRLGGDFFQTRATYIPASGAPRTLAVSGPPQRVAFEPPLGDAIATLARRGVDQLGNQRLLWLFILCLAVPVRRLDATRAPFAVFAAVHAVALGLVAVRTAATSDDMFYLAQFVAGAAVIVAAVQNIIGSGRLSSVIVAAIFGLASGILLGSAVHELLPLAGSNGGLAVTAFAGLVTVSAGALLAILLSLLRLPYRLRAPEWLVTAALCALPAHEAAHVVVDVAGRLGQRNPWDQQPAVALLVAHWPVLAVAAFLALMTVMARATRLPGGARDGRTT